MKKSTLVTLIILLLLALAVNMTSCAGRSQSKKDESTDTVTETEVAVIELPTHNSKSETVTEETTVDLLEQPKEKETEPAPEEKPIESLRYSSYGNGTCAVSGIGSCTDLFIVIPERSPSGDIVTSIEEKAFYGNKNIKAVEIPSTVTSIGDMAFGGCSSLVYLSVDKSNHMFTDIGGILYTKDGSSLLAYPSSCGATELSISSNVKRIASMAFFDCDSLKVIKYSGSLTDWGKIDIGDMNYGLFTASVSCTSGK